MFKKLVSNLPYSPSLLPQVSFYIKRLQQENITRLLGVILAGLAMFVQVLFMVAAPVPSIASDANDLVRGGLRTDGGHDMSEAQAKQYLVEQVYGANAVAGLQELFEHYEVTAADIATSQETFICSKDEPNSSRGCTNPEDRNLRSIGRERNPKAPASDVRLQVPDRTETYYHRPLHGWDSSETVATRYKALSIDNGRIYILYSCANIVFREATEAIITTEKTITNPTTGTATPGQTLTFQLRVVNTGTAPAHEVLLSDRLNPNLTPFTPIADGGTVLRHSDTQSRVDWNIGTLQPGQQAVRSVSVYVEDSTTDPEICNRSDVHFVQPSGEQTTVHSQPVACIRIEPIAEAQPPQRPVTSEPQSPPPTVTTTPPFCTNLALVGSSSTVTVPARVSFRPTYEARATEAELFSYFIDGRLVQSSPNSSFSHEFTQADTYLVQLSISFSDGTSTEKSDCQATVLATTASVERIDQSKSARIISDYTPVTVDADDPRSLNADQSTVTAGEFIEYRIAVHNTGDTTLTDYTLPEEHLKDALDYADVIDNSGQVVRNSERYSQPLQLLGGGVLENNIITWPAESSFTPEEQIEKIFFMQVKDPIPATNQVVSNQLRYDCRIDNNYSNTITLYVDCPLEKQLEQSIQTLPNTGPGQTFTVMVVGGSLSYYFYKRNQLLATELRIVKKEYTGGGA